MSLRGLLLSACVAAALAVATFPLVPAGIPLGADTVTHLYTLVHVDDLVHHGVFFSRWLPWQNGGLGNPRFLYYPALPFYLAEIWVLLGFDHVVAMRLAMAVALLAAAAGCFAWCRERHGPGAAALGAVAYVLSPYVLFASYARCSFAELTALGLAPWALWAGERFLRRGGPWLAASAALLGLTVLAHPITGALMLGAWMVLTWAGAEGARKRIAASYALFVALGLSAVLWLPARLERAAISDAHTQSPGLDYRQAFLPFDALLAMPGDRLVAGYAPVALALALVAIGTALWRRQGRDLLGVTVAWLALSLAVLPLARPLWDAFASIARDVQFPHRLLGPASLLLAALAAAGAAALGRALTHEGATGRWVARLGFLVLLVGLATNAWPLRYLARLPELPPLDIEFVMRKERQAGMLGMGYQGEFLPHGLSALGHAWRVAPGTAERLVAESLPADARLVETSYEPLRYEALVESPAPWTAIWATLTFPGWKAEADGTVLETGASEEGLLSTDVPAGRQRIVVRFGTTPARVLGATVSAFSALALVAMVLATLVAERRRQPGPTAP